MKRSAVHAFAAAVACMVATSADAAPFEAQGTVALAIHGEALLRKLNGVWRSRGYGWLWSIENGEIRFYHESANLCLSASDAIDSLERRLGDGLEIGDNEQLMRLPIEDPSYRYTFDKIDALPEKCHRKPDPGPISVLDAVDNIFTVHYAFFQTRHIDWPALVSASRRRVTADISDKQLFQIVKELLASINDAHVSLTAKIGGKTFTYEAGEGRTLGALAAQARREGLDLEDMRERWETDYWTRDIGETLLGGAGHEVAGGNIKFGLIDNDIGFLSIRSMDDFADDEHKGEFSALDTAMDGAMALFKAAKAVIVDISLNDGGYDTLGRHIAGRFASERTLGYYKKAGDASGDRPQAIYIEPSERARYTGPVYLITSNFTLSAAEVFTICMRALANVTHVGEATRGALSDELTKPLPNGWSLTLSNEVYQDADGMAWEGSGIPPKVPIEVFSRGDVTVGHVRAVRAVIDMVRSR